MLKIAYLMKLYADFTFKPQGRRLNILKTDRFIMRYFLGTPFLMILLAGCATSVPDDSPGYFDSITPDPVSLEVQAQEEQLLEAEGLPRTVRPPADGTVQSGSTVIPANKSVKGNAAPLSDGSISNSQDFLAVKANESIASDAAKIQGLKENYTIIQPGAAPVRGSDINLAKYALTQSNPIGQKAYTRYSVGSAKAKRKCTRYNSADEAQQAFLKSGGPQRDRNGIDPDGDGYACNWSPATYRSMLGQ